MAFIAGIALISAITILALLWQNIITLFYKKKKAKG